MKKSSLKLRVPALLLGLALVLGLALTGCPSEASSEGGGVDGLKLSKPKNVTVLESKILTAVTANAAASQIADVVVVNFEAPNQGPRQVEYVIWVREKAKKKELLIADTTASYASNAAVSGNFLAGPTNQQVLSADVGKVNYALLAVTALDNTTLDRENGEDHKWCARISTDVLLSQLDGFQGTLSTHKYDITNLASGQSLTFQIGVQAVVPQDTTAGDAPRYFVNPSDIVWNTKTPIVVSVP